MCSLDTYLECSSQPVFVQARQHHSQLVDIPSPYIVETVLRRTLEQGRICTAGKCSERLDASRRILVGVIALLAPPEDNQIVRD
jgi:hypothetical protein